MRKTIGFLTLFLSTLSIDSLSAEPSVFGAGNLSIDNPYGLTKTEKVVLENKESIKDLNRDSVIIKKHIQKNESSIETLRGLVTTVGKKTHDNKVQLNLMLKDVEHLMSVTDLDKQVNDKKYTEFQNQQLKDKQKINEALKSNFELINTNIETFVKDQNTNLEKINTELNKLQQDLKNLEAVVKNIDKNYATQTQVNAIVKEFNNFKETILKEFETVLEIKEKEESFDFSKYSNMDIFNEAKRLMSIDKYDEAIKYFQYLISRHYRPASSNYYIGECYYAMKNYQQAIAHYKNSVSIYDQSKFMPELLLHTGLSFEYINDTRNAKNFFSLLVSQYPSAPESAQARQKLEKIQ